MRRWQGPLIVSVVYLALWLGLDAIASLFQARQEVSLWYPPDRAELRPAARLRAALRPAPPADRPAARAGGEQPRRELGQRLARWRAQHRRLHDRGLAPAPAAADRPRLTGQRDVTWFLGLAAGAGPFVVAAGQVLQYAAAGLLPWGSCSGASSASGPAAPRASGCWRPLCWSRAGGCPRSGATGRRCPPRSGRDGDEHSSVVEPGPATVARPARRPRAGPALELVGRPPSARDGVPGLRRAGGRGWTWPTWCTCRSSGSPSVAGCPGWRSPSSSPTPSPWRWSGRDVVESPLRLQLGLVTLTLAGLTLGALVTGRQASIAAAEHAAVHDSLTGLANRVLLMDRVDAAAHRAERSPTPGSRCSTATWTASRGSTTSSGTTPATSCSWRSRAGWRRPCGPATWSVGSAGTRWPSCSTA
jgi:hypothetical protein